MAKRKYHRCVWCKKPVTWAHMTYVHRKGDAAKCVALKREQGITEGTRVEEYTPIPRKRKEAE